MNFKEQEKVEKVLIDIYTQSTEKLIDCSLQDLSEDDYYAVIELVHNIAIDKYNNMSNDQKKDRGSIKKFCKQNPLKLYEINNLEKILGINLTNDLESA